MSKETTPDESGIEIKVEATNVVHYDPPVAFDVAAPVVAAAELERLREWKHATRRALASALYDSGSEFDHAHVLLFDTVTALDGYLRAIGDEMAGTNLHPADKVKRLVRGLGGEG